MLCCPYDTYWLPHWNRRWFFPAGGLTFRKTVLLDQFRARPRSLPKTASHKTISVGCSIAAHFLIKGNKAELPQRDRATLYYLKSCQIAFEKGCNSQSSQMTLRVIQEHRSSAYSLVHTSLPVSAAWNFIKIFGIKEFLDYHAALVVWWQV